MTYGRSVKAGAACFAISGIVMFGFTAAATEATTQTTVSSAAATQDTASDAKTDRGVTIAGRESYLVPSAAPAPLIKDLPAAPSPGSMRVDAKPQLQAVPVKPRRFAVQQPPDRYPVILGITY